MFILGRLYIHVSAIVVFKSQLLSFQLLMVVVLFLMCASGCWRLSKVLVLVAEEGSGDVARFIIRPGAGGDTVSLVRS